MQRIITISAKETQGLAKSLARKILSEKTNRESALIIGLTGDLGSGKTTFAQGLAKGLGIKQKIISPTFVILKNFKITKKSKILNPKSQTNPKSKIQTKHRFQNINFQNFIHIDAYRLENSNELVDLSWNEIIKNPRNIILIEWADRVKKILPKNHIKINFKSMDKNKREISVSKIRPAA